MTKTRRGNEPLEEPIVKTIGKGDDLKWIVANRYTGNPLAGPFDEEFQAYQALKVSEKPKKKGRNAKAD